MHLVTQADSSAGFTVCQNIVKICIQLFNGIPVSYTHLLSYLLFGIGCFFLISTVTSNLIMKQVVVEKASAFYQEVIYMSDQYVGNYFEQQNDLSLIHIYSNHGNHPLQ